MTYKLILLSRWALLLLPLFALPSCSAYYDYAMPQPLIVPTVALAGAVAIEDQMEMPEQDDEESSFLELAYDVIRTPGYVLGYGIVIQGAFLWAMADGLIGNDPDIGAKLNRLSASFAPTLTSQPPPRASLSPAWRSHDTLKNFWRSSRTSRNPWITMKRPIYPLSRTYPVAMLASVGQSRY
jgi:hypothetical protein